MPVTILLQQRILTRGQGRVFPHNHRSVSAAFTRACNKLKIEDLHFHDLRHEGTSRLFEAGLTIEKVALERFPLDVNRDSTGDFLWCANQIRLL
jgi:integrase